MHRKRNPFPTVETGLDEAEQLLEAIIKNAFPKGKRRNPPTPEWYTPIIDPALAESAGYDPQLFTPLNIVSANVKPKVSAALLDLVLNDPEERQKRPGFYRKMIEALETTYPGTTYDPNTGNIPTQWIEPQKGAFRPKPSTLEDTYNQLRDIYTEEKLPSPANYEEFRSKLSQQKVAKARKLKKHQRRRNYH